MALTALSIGRKVEYIPKAERSRLEEDQAYRPTVFLLRPPTAHEYAAFTDAVRTVSGDSMRINLEAAAVMALSYCLRGWRNYRRVSPDTGQLEPAVFQGTEESGPKEVDVSLIPPALRIELYREIKEMGEIPPEDFPSSGSPAELQSSRKPSDAEAAPGASATPTESCGSPDQTGS